MVEARKSGCPSGHASAPSGLISDRKASDLAPSLSSATGSANCGLHVMVKQARDRQFENLDAQQEALKDENGDEYWSNPQGRHDPDELLDLVPMRYGAETETIDNDEILMAINITGPAHLQSCIRNLCSKYIDIFSPTVKIEPARVPPLSMKVALDKGKDKRNRLSPRFLTRDKDADLRKQIALLESLGVIEKSTASEYSQVHLVRKLDQSWRL